MENELTQAQIEAEGWTLLRTKDKITYYEKGLHGLKYNTVTKEAFFCRIDINSIRNYEDDIVSRATCPDLKTFKYVCKMLNI